MTTTRRATWRHEAMNRDATAQLLFSRDVQTPSKQRQSSSPRIIRPQTSPTSCVTSLPRISRPAWKRSRSSSRQPHEHQLPLFEIDEIQTGRLLGSGAFCEVYEIESFQQQKQFSLCACQQARRDFMTKHAQRHNKRRRLLRRLLKREQPVSRYALKVLQVQWQNNPHKFQAAATDLAKEAELLRHLDHPNIVKLRGSTLGGTDAYQETNRCDAYFLILDRLDEILTTRLQQWKQERNRFIDTANAQSRKLRQRQDHSTQQRQELWLTRLQVALDLSNALEYLHSRRIGYFDLKPQNVGFTRASVVQLFDFGLAKRLKTDDTSFRGPIGTKRYMAYEVALGLRYNRSADVYSFSIVLWQILSLETPFQEYSRLLFEEKVLYGSDRLPVDASWPRSLQELLNECWKENPNERPTMQRVSSVLEQTIQQVKPTILQTATKTKDNKTKSRPTQQQRGRRGSSSTFVCDLPLELREDLCCNFVEQSSSDEELHEEVFIELAGCDFTKPSKSTLFEDLD